MARRKQSGRVRYEMSVAFDESQKNLPDILTRLTEKVNRKQDSSDLEQIVSQNDYSNAKQFQGIQNQITEIETTESVMPTDQITSTGASAYLVGFDMTGDSEAQYSVSINGLVQDPLSDYTIDLVTNEILFPTPPVVGADIVITQRNTSTFDGEQAINDFLSALQS